MLHVDAAQVACACRLSLWRLIRCEHALQCLTWPCGVADTVLFADTIMRNLAYGRPSATRAEIVKAAGTRPVLELYLVSCCGALVRPGGRSTRLLGRQRWRSWVQQLRA